MRILITRLSAIGDCILTVPVLCALREHFPHAFLGWIVERPAAPLLAGHRDLDELIVVPRGWLKSAKTVWKLRRQLKQLAFDVAVDPQSLTKSALLARLSGARRRIGFDGDDGRELSKWLNNKRVHCTASHVVDRSLELLKPLGVRTSTARFDLPTYDDAAETMTDFVRAHQMETRFALINVGAGWPSKLWPGERFGAVAKHLSRQHGMPSVVIWSGAAERQTAEEAMAVAGDAAILAPPTSLTELAELARRATMFFGCDTGPLHISAAVGTPCVALFGPTLPEVCGPYGSNHVTVQAYHQKAEGNRERRGAENVAMRAIDVDMACAACDRIIEQLTIQAAAEAA
jgi:lipopolysaccharide heptosyltransferase I